MPRPKSVNYRKIAFAHYKPICTYCGFGVKEVLEIAHLDCDPANCSVENLAVLCPTCHRMHDIGLIPSDIVVHLRDKPSKADWSKLYKDAPLKALATKKKTPGLLKEAAKKAVATRKARKAALGSK